MKLAYQIDVFGHYFCYYIICNDQFVNIFQIDRVVFQIWVTLNVQANFVI